MSPYVSYTIAVSLSQVYLQVYYIQHVALCQLYIAVSLSQVYSELIRSSRSVHRPAYVVCLSTIHTDSMNQILGAYFGKIHKDCGPC